MILKKKVSFNFFYEISLNLSFKHLLLIFRLQQLNPDHFFGFYSIEFVTAMFV